MRHPLWGRLQRLNSKNKKNNNKKISGISFLIPPNGHMTNNGIYYRVPL